MKNLKKHPKIKLQGKINSRRTKKALIDPILDTFQYHLYNYFSNPHTSELQKVLNAWY